MTKNNANLLQGLNIYLVGRMGVGKTSVGKAVAEQLSYRFLDTDDLITKIQGQPITEIFSQQGETYFRELETKVLEELSTYTRSVIATGGGIILKPENWSFLQQGLVVWLNAGVDLLMERLAQDESRPLLQTANPRETLERLLEERYSQYAQADLQINIHADESPSAIASRMIQEIPTVVKSQNSAS